MKSGAPLDLAQLRDEAVALIEGALDEASSALGLNSATTALLRIFHRVTAELEKKAEVEKEEHGGLCTRQTKTI